MPIKFLDLVHDFVIIFSDFACRNCLVMSDLSVKVGDYGVAEDHYRVSSIACLSLTSNSKHVCSNVNLGEKAEGYMYL